MSGRDHSVLSPADAMQRAVRAHEVGNFALAEWLCSGILAHYPEHFEALNLLGVIKAQTRRSQEAAALLEHAVAVRPGNATTHNNYANVLRDLGHFHEALEHYDRALALEPTTPLFDTGLLLTRHLETGYMEIYRRHHAGLRPDDVFVE